jgi:chitin synthase
MADGRSKIDPAVLDVLSLLGVYQDGIMVENIDNRPVTAHMFEYTTQMAITSKFKVLGSKDSVIPVQVLFCLKERNAQKVILSFCSHN